MQISKYHSDNLYIDSFSIEEEQSWCMLGSNSSGISEFIELLSNREKNAGQIEVPDTLAIISFTRQQEIFEEELKKDDTDFINRIDPGTPARDFISHLENHTDLIRKFNLQDCLDKGYRQLSTGESRKLLLLSSISANPGIIVIENPFDGLDAASCLELDQALEILHLHGRQIILTVNNLSDIPTWVTHLAVFANNRIALQGLRHEIYNRAAAAMSQNGSASFSYEPGSGSARLDGGELVSLVNGSARYGENVIFSHLSFSVRSGQHTLITGPNGSGKSTLLQIITGDNQNCYANNLHLFGRKRGTGESIWEIKKKMGIVSPDLHRNHFIPGSALQVVLSGFFDSIGVYTRFSASDHNSAMKWLQMIGLANKARHSFRRLSFAEQRLCLIARALIKTPELLILDEPTQGLDQHNRNNLLDFLEQISRQNISTILYASHRSDEFRSFFQQHIDLSK